MTGAVGNPNQLLPEVWLGMSSKAGRVWAKKATSIKTTRIRF